ncbi:MAG TPA: hypothetical protein VN622_07750 [Clostridia bacterium]|nr:hypothetical protein [Clostridia bacterium]
MRIGVVPNLLLAISFALTASFAGCGGGETLFDICGCVPTSPASKDHRHAEKHVPLPNIPTQEITVSTILGWPIDPALLPPDAPRAGRELKLFHIAHAYVQTVRIEHSDCDLHMEISDTADKMAPRAIVETPVDGEYCSARQAIQQQLAKHGIFVGHEQVGELPQEITPALQADIVGLAFEDFNHPGRGTALVATIWELHPAIVKLLE